MALTRSRSRSHSPTKSVRPLAPQSQQQPNHGKQMRLHPEVPVPRSVGRRVVPPSRPAAATAGAATYDSSILVERSSHFPVSAASIGVACCSSRKGTWPLSEKEAGTPGNGRQSGSTTPRTSLRLQARRLQQQPQHHQRSAHINLTEGPPKGARLVRCRGSHQGTRLGGPRRGGDATGTAAARGTRDALQGLRAPRAPLGEAAVPLPEGSPEPSCVSPLRSRPSRLALQPLSAAEAPTVGPKEGPADAEATSEAHLSLIPPSPHSPLLSESTEDPQIDTSACTAAATAVEQPCCDEGETLADGLLGVCGETLPDPLSVAAAAARQAPAAPPEAAAGAPEEGSSSSSSSSCCCAVDWCLCSLNDLHTGLTPRPSQQQGPGACAPHLLQAPQGAPWAPPQKHCGCGGSRCCSSCWIGSGLVQWGAGNSMGRLSTSSVCSTSSLSSLAAPPAAGAAAAAQKRLLQRVALVLSSNAALAAASAPLLAKSKRGAAAAAAATAAGATPPKVRGPSATARIRTSSTCKPRGASATRGPLKIAPHSATPTKRGRGDGCSAAHSCSNRTSIRVRERAAAAAAAEAAAAEAAAAIRTASSSAQKQRRLQQQKHQQQEELLGAQLEGLLQDLQQETTRGW